MKISCESSRVNGDIREKLMVVKVYTTRLNFVNKYFAFCSGIKPTISGRSVANTNVKESVIACGKLLKLYS